MLSPFKTYEIIKDIKDLQKAKTNPLCNHIIYENNTNIYIWNYINGKWDKVLYNMYGKIKARDTSTTGFKAYMEFYKYVGKSEVERMKEKLELIDRWDSCEQLHFYNYEYVDVPIKQVIVEFDVNSAFTYGVMKLDDDFKPFKEYMQMLYDKKEMAKSDVERSKYKNLQTYLIGYFAKVKEFVSLRSKIIDNSNKHIIRLMTKVTAGGGTVYLSNTDSIVTDTKGYKILEPYIGTKLGQLKVSTVTDRLYYKSSNCYQLGDKVVYSGVKYFSRKHTDLFTGQTASQTGSLVEGYDFDYETTDEDEKRLCRVRNGTITVNVFNSLGELIDIIEYRGKL